MPIFNFPYFQMEDTPLHPDTNLVADILGQRPDVAATPPTVASTASESEEQAPALTKPKPNPPHQYLPVSIENPPCGGLLMAKVNEVDTLFSPGKSIQ